jgi:Tfp pilus assembly protein PilF
MGKLSLALVVSLGLVLSSAMVLGQNAPPAQTPPSPPTAPGRTTTPSPGRSTTSPQAPGVSQPQQPRFQQPIFLSGRVMLDDGARLPEPVLIERVCNGVVRPEAYTDSKGRFSFQVGQAVGIIPDASVDSMSSGAIPGMGSRGSSPFGGSSMTEMPVLAGCELRASLPGYISGRIDLIGRRGLDNPDVGTILLHRMANVAGVTVSATSLMAPKDAKKALEKGQRAARKKKWDEAQKNLQRAVQIYPKYAAAWFELGLVHQERNQIPQARSAYAQALAADSKFVKPYLQTARLAMHDKNWGEAVHITDELLRLDPVDYLAAYYFNAVANFHLNKMDAAEKSARQGMKLDPNHRVPAFERVLSVILANKQDYAGAAQLLKSYLEHAPNATDAGAARKQLAEFEKFTGPPTAQAKPQP